MVNLVLLGIEVDLGSVMPYGQAPPWFYEARQDGEADAADASPCSAVLHP